jgi:Sigma-70 region 2
MSAQPWDTALEHEALAKKFVRQYFGEGIRTGHTKPDKGIKAPPALKKRRKALEEDLVQEALIAIHRAAEPENFDPDAGYKFSTYAGYAVAEALQKAARRLVDPLKAEDPHIKSTRSGGRKEKLGPNTPGSGLPGHSTSILPVSGAGPPAHGTPTIKRVFSQRALQTSRDLRSIDAPLQGAHIQTIIKAAELLEEIALDGDSWLREAEQDLHDKLATKLAQIIEYNADNPDHQQLANTFRKALLRKRQKEAQ